MAAGSHVFLMFPGSGNFGRAEWGPCSPLAEVPAQKGEQVGPSHFGSASSDRRTRPRRPGPHPTGSELRHARRGFLTTPGKEPGTPAGPGCYGADWSLSDSDHRLRLLAASSAFCPERARAPFALGVGDGGGQSPRGLCLVELPSFMSICPLVCGLGIAPGASGARRSVLSGGRGRRGI